MTIPLPVILDFELHATVLGHPATVALRRVVEGARHWYSYEYHIRCPCGWAAHSCMKMVESHPEWLVPRSMFA
jgi:hypothetical protein